LTYITIEQLKSSLQVSLVVDVRSELEFNTAHIINAWNVPFSNRGFLVSIKKLTQQFPDKQLVVYCNGHSCEKSYQAGRVLVRNQYNSTVFDAGMKDWLLRFPEYSMLLGKMAVDSHNIISEQEFESHLVNYDDFIKLSNSAYVFDIRDIYQRGSDKLLFNQRSVTMDKMLLILEEKKFQDNTLLIFDATGWQSRWLQYHLKKHHYYDYYFLRGGYRSIEFNLKK
ncbi:MAG: hypothetical protein GY787_08230, partial [Alteromonadales bacterium]|nr:hypothetical protein [Alteromonadales bacterium]